MKLQKVAFAVTMMSAIISWPADQSNASERDESYHQDFIFGAPVDPSEAWMITSGGRIYDNWYKALDKEKPQGTHKAWPGSNTKKKGAVTWRCKSCHGWDFSGKDGAYATGSYKTGIAGVQSFEDKNPQAILTILRNSTHGYTADMIPDDAAMRIGILLTKGQYNTKAFIAADKSVSGDIERGKAVFQTVCAACHGFNGKALNWGDEKKPGYIGTEAMGNPWETMFKIRHGHPGVEMVGLAALPMKTSIDLLSYLRTLPAK